MASLSYRLGLGLGITVLMYMQWLDRKDQSPFQDGKSVTYFVMTALINALFELRGVKLFRSSS